jgi:hypothetical protein
MIDAQTSAPLGYFKPYQKIMRWEAIGGLCLFHGYRYGAELGVSHGRFSSYLCSLMEDMRMIAIDLWEEQPQNAKSADPGAETFLRQDGWFHSEKLENLKKHVETHFPGRIDIRRSHSVEAAKGVQDETLDFVFIDADHTYEGCLADILAWTPKVKFGGMISGHDYSDRWPGVMKAVKETGPAILGPDSIWIRTRR